MTTGKFLPQNYAQKIANIASYVQRYRLLKTQKNPVKSFYVMTLVFITMLIIFAASWIGFHLAKSITVPIEKLAQATKEVSRGNLDVRVEDPASDEIGTLIDSFNQMISDLKASQRDIAQKTVGARKPQALHETILNNITTGVIALDAGGVDHHHQPLGPGDAGPGRQGPHRQERPGHPQPAPLRRGPEEHRLGHQEPAQAGRQGDRRSPPTGRRPTSPWPCPR